MLANESVPLSVTLPTVPLVVVSPTCKVAPAEIEFAPVLLKVPVRISFPEATVTAPAPVTMPG